MSQFADTIPTMTKKQHYAVVRGRKPGVYDRWGGEDGAEAQIKGFPGAVFRGFASRYEADQYFRAGGKTAAGGSSKAPGKGSAQASAKTSHEADLAAGKTVIFTDGASTGNPGPGGYGVVMLHAQARRELSGGFRCTTNNRMELTAVIVALQSLQKRASVVVYSDSRYVVDAVEKGWARRWRTRGWMRNTQNRAENSDLWAALLDLIDQHAVEFRWVRGHASSPENERCDVLAVEAAHAPDLPEDPGYTGRCRG
jgi:ribonuclease HI